MDKNRFFTRGRVIAILIAGSVVLAGTGTAAGVAIADANRTALYRSTLHTLNQKLTSEAKSVDDVNTANLALEQALADGRGKAAAITVIAAAEAAVAQSDREALTALLPPLTESLGTEAELAALTATNDPLRMAEETAPELIKPVVDDKISDSEIESLQSRSQKVSDQIKATEENRANLHSRTNSTRDAWTAVGPVLVTATGNIRAVAQQTLEATTSADAATHEAILAALSSIESTELITADTDPNPENVTALLDAYTAYVETITARVAAHTAEVERAAAAAAAAQNAPAYTAPDGTQKPNPRFNPQRPSTGGTPTAPKPRSGGSSSGNGGGGTAPTPGGSSGGSGGGSSTPGTGGGGGPASLPASTPVGPGLVGACPAGTSPTIRGQYQQGGGGGTVHFQAMGIPYIVTISGGPGAWTYQQLGCSEPW
ncbi:hypothetical protein [Lysinibacter sp. HNR]|uniref:hypothetical protein n=1 Tax=Lysinibacter sp. HNR TaxID=3031408 RepID=UPI0024351D16|nr:hypothetical protein [Lysinibacter sp. HNR]WGD37585.1 hypothetical protein FrondiHNR_01275 [Lysinibacter sp. HNR]